MKRGPKSAAHRAEMEARAARRAQRDDINGQPPDRLPAKHTTTGAHGLAAIKANKVKQDRKRLKRIENAAATAEGKQWRGDATR